jgi:hypothetical protein
VAELRPRLLVELGTHSGLSFFTFCQAVREHDTGTLCYAVDTWKGDKHAGFYDDSVFREVDRHRQQTCEDFAYLLRLTFDEAVRQFSDGSIDLLHIDGLHTYEAVKHDYETWLPKVREGGVILFHDIAARHEDFGVWKLWEEVADANRAFAFDSGWGLGVLRTSLPAEEASPLLRSLFGTGEERARVRDYYRTVSEPLATARRLEEATTALAEARGSLARANDALGAKTRELEERTRERESLNGLVTAMQKTVSWRITSPIRWVKQLFTRRP